MITDSETLEDFLGEEVVDPQATPIGTLACFWDSPDGTPVLLGIDVEELLDKTHLLPAKGAELDERKSYVTVQFTKEKVRKAPCLECGGELTPQLEKKVFAYYGASSFDEDIMAEDASPRELRRKSRD
ncbi:MAG: hypothetical protein ABIR24_00265 [Verrucomicrobiota bacterium]